ncbi:Dabb family protein [Neokomagataea anthophila]|uniref:Dabb family protein n=1 Tax=Neokomagataea anthophila TaxID=2826925 RepID=A0ABS5E5V2_9PROT|nr:Dabb family protein [Neokomagataea anthophila]MBR0559280.1 Dabb family protein [Neokomagataea anthophila]
MSVMSSVVRPVVLTAIVGLVAFGLAQPAEAQVDPYSLPIASSGPIVLPPQSLPPQIVATQELAKQVGYAQFTAPGWRVGTVRHVVMLRYRTAVTEQQKAEVTARFLRLVQDSRRADGRPVIESIETGAQNDGNGGIFDQIFTLTFHSEGDRNFFVGAPIVPDTAFTDPAHAAFKAFAGPLIRHILIADYDVGVTVRSSPRAVHYSGKHDRSLH